ncbi:hypothetical protein E2P81_ATG10847 [Venturia nashicola]|nr:hypothetical protein E2P81_ATG10847 [Venturia nashicola]
MVNGVAYGVPFMRRLAMIGIVHARISNEMESESWSQLPILLESRTTLQTLELVEESPTGDEEDQLVETRHCFLQFAKFARLSRLKVLWWNTPHWQPDLVHPERNIISKALTSFEIVVNEYDMRLSTCEFLLAFKNKPALFHHLHIFPKLRIINWSLRLGHRS